MNISSNRAYARNSDPNTSHMAADDIQPHVTNLQHMVLSALQDNGAMTTEQVAEYLGINIVSISPRFRPMAIRGVISDTGERRQNKSGRSAIVWRAVNNGAQGV